MMVKKQQKKELQKTYDSIYRQWIWADYLRNLFKDSLPENTLDLSGNFTIEPYWMLMSLWYGILFSVIEALDLQKIGVPEIQNDIKQMYQILKKYRNAVFHVQKKYWPEKWRKLIIDEESAQKIHRIHKSIGLFLLNCLIKES